MESRRRVSLPTILVLIALAATSAFALKAPDADPTRPGPYVYQLQARIPQLESVENGLVDAATGAYASLVNQKAGPYAGSAEQVARAYLADKSGRFGLTRGGSDLVLDAVQDVPGGSHVRFVQSVGGVPIYRADLVVSLDASGKFVTAVASNYDGLVDRGVGTTATLTPAQAREIAIGSLGINGTPQFTGDTTEGLWIVRDEDIAGSTPHLAWRITVPIMQPLGDWEVFVDARSGEVLRLLDQSLYIDGSGSAFDPDPLTTAGANYNTPAGSYTDNNDADHATLTAQIVTRTLPELTLISGLYYLRGPWVYIDEFESPTSAPATSADPNRFTFTRNAQGFEDSNAYHQIDKNQRYIQSLGFANIQHGSIHVDTHGLNGDDNSHFIPSTNRIAWGEGGVDDAEDADVLLHEYGHAIQSSSRPGWGGGQQSSMGEGFGDYWCGSYSASISDFHNTWVFNWDGHNPYWGGRILNGTGMYGSWGSDIYTNGTSWASCLWLMRAEMGRTALDTDVLKHHFYQGTSATAAQAAAFLMQADHDLYAGLHGGTIENFFVLRGFLTGAQFDVPALTHTALPATVNTVGPFPVTVTVTSVSAVTAGSVKVKFGTGGLFDQEVVLNPTGNPNEWGGEIPVQAPQTTFDYYIIADNAATWRGASPRGAEYKHNSVFVDVAATGACCTPDAVTCTVVTQAACASPNIWSGVGTTCTPSPCVVMTGACCSPDAATCTVVIEADCASPDTWSGLGTTCTPSPCVSGVDEAEVSAILGVHATPNPFNGKVALHVTGPKATAARVAIFDAGGRLVRTAWSGTLNGRALAVNWDGRDDSGHPAPAGIYLVRLEGVSGTAVVRLVMTR